MKIKVKVAGNGLFKCATFQIALPPNTKNALQKTNCKIAKCKNACEVKNIFLAKWSCIWFLTEITTHNECGFIKRFVITIQTDFSKGRTISFLPSPTLVQLDFNTSKLSPYNRNNWGSGCGLVGKVVASDIGGPRFESSQHGEHNLLLKNQRLGYIKHLSLPVSKFS